MTDDPTSTSANALAPAPDFRYVGLEPGPHPRVGLWASVLGASATLGAGLYHGISVRGVVFTAIAAAAGALALRKVGGPVAGRWGAQPVAMAIVPWGILVNLDGKHESTPRVLRWGAIKSVHLEMLHGRDEGTPTTLWSVVTVVAQGERLAARANGAVSIDRLLAHLDAYAAEQSHRIALDLDGVQATDALEPELEPLLTAAVGWVDTAPASSRLGLSPGGYRTAAARTASPEAIGILRAVLADRTPKATDPRAFAAVLAAELRATELIEDLVALVQSPQPVIAAVARVAARKLGVATARAGALDEVSPFLTTIDVDVLRAWGEETRNFLNP